MDLGPRRFDLAWNGLVLAALWAAYAIVRSITSGDLTAASHNAATVIDVQHSLGLPNEAAIQAAVLGSTWLIKFTNVYYIGVHFPLTLMFLVWVWRKHRPSFGRVRNALVATTTVGLVVHVLYPLKPPRMMSGFVDTAQTIGPDPYELGVSGGANQLAAMPSLHVGWALLVALGVIWLGTSRARWLILAHPVITLAVVVITANHYWADTIIAAIIVTAAWLLTRPKALTRGSRNGISSGNRLVTLADSRSRRRKSGGDDQDDAEYRLLDTDHDRRPRRQPHGNDVDETERCEDDHSSCGYQVL